MLLALYDKQGAIVGSVNLDSTKWTPGDNGFVNAESIDVKIRGCPTRFNFLDDLGRVISGNGKLKIENNRYPDCVIWTTRFYPGKLEFNFRLFENQSDSMPLPVIA